MPQTGKLMNYLPAFSSAVGSRVYVASVRSNHFFFRNYLNNDSGSNKHLTNIETNVTAHRALFLVWFPSVNNVILCFNSADTRINRCKFLFAFRT